MKKFLLTLAAVAMCAGAAFADADITVANVSAVTSGSYPETWGGGDFTFKTLKNNGATAPTYNKNGKDIRLYAKNTFEVIATNDMTSIVFTISAQGLKRQAPITASTGTITAQNTGDATVTWTGNAKDVVFTVGDYAEFGSEKWKDEAQGKMNAGQMDFTAIKIVGGGTFTEGPVTPTDPNYFKATTIESGSGYVFVADGKYSLLFDRNFGYMSAGACPEGTTDSFYGNENAAMTFTAVAGGYNITTTGGKLLGAKAGYNTFDTTDDSADNRVWTVSFNADGTATIVNVATSKTVAQDPQYGSFGCYDADALEGKNLPTLFKFGGQVVPPTPPTTATFQLANAITSGSDYVMVVDNQVGTAISQSSSYGRLSLADATITDGKLTTEITNAITITAEGSGYTLKDAYNRYLGFDGTHTTSFQLYNEVSELCTWNIEFTNGQALMTLTAEGKTGTIGVTKGTNGTWYTNIAPSVDADDIKLPALYVKTGSTSVSNITVADENAPVEYFNLQGVRVANPENGLYIRRQGSNVSKVYVR